ncbi:MAG: glycerophosphodiester phosphodiesterase, partial [Anaerolineae bacterium]
MTAPDIRCFYPHTPLNLAHRGASHAAPENTMVAFRLAAELGADGLEVDVQLSRDGEAVVIHDADVSRTTQGRGRVGDLSLDQIRALDAGSHKGGEFAGEGVPTLAQVLEELGQRLLLNIELKTWSLGDTGLEAEVVRLVEDAGLAHRVIISSFNPLALRRVRRLNPNLWRGLLLAPRPPFWLAGPLPRWLARPHALHPHWRAINADWLKREQRRGLAVNIWTCDDPDA